uniref:Hint domain-containing protein n=1 Tax=Puniceibacterium confluentis TaxID=1958944 RepID=UPI003567DC6B
MEPKTAGRTDGNAVGVRMLDPRIGNALVAGTTVLTLDGALPAEYLSPGDRVITRDAGMAVLADVRQRKLSCPAVSVLAGTLGNTRPDRDAVLPASQEMLIRDWRAQALFGRSCALVPARRLVDGEFIRDLGEVELMLVELIFDTPHIL